MSSGRNRHRAFSEDDTLGALDRPDGLYPAALTVTTACAATARIRRTIHCWASRSRPKRSERAGLRKGTQQSLPPGLEPKTVVNTHRMPHVAWEDFVAWGWAKRNVVKDAHPPRVVRKGRKVWTVAQLQTFLQCAQSDRIFALWVLEAMSGMRRC